MGGPDSEIKVKFTTEHDGKGADAARQSVRKVRGEAEQGAAGFGRLGKEAKGAAGMIRSAMSGFGWAAVIMAAVRAYQSLMDKIGEAKKRAEELGEEQKKADAGKAVDGLSEKYRLLSERIADAHGKMKALDELAGMEKKAERAVEDAVLAMNEDSELAGIAPEHPDRALLEKEVRERYGRRRGLLAVSRKKEDIILERQRLQGQADALDADADEKEGSLKEDDALIYQAKKSLAVARQQSKATRRNWRGVSVDDAEAQDKGRVASQELEGRLKTLEDNRSKKEREIDGIRREAGLALDKAEAHGKMFAALDTELAVADQSGSRAVRDAQGDIREASAKRAKEKAEAEQARRDKAAAEAERRRLKDAEADAEWRRQETERAAFVARRGLDAHDANRPARGSDTKWRNERAGLQSRADSTAEAAAEAAREASLVKEASVEGFREIARELREARSGIRAAVRGAARDAYGDRGG